MRNRRRRSIRLPGYDYRTYGAYFITICTYRRRATFNHRASREAAAAVWRALPGHHAGIEVDEFVVMPNHIHGILWLPHRKGVGAQPAAPLRAHRLSAGGLGAVVRSYKAAVTRAIHSIRGDDPPVWQRNYYEHVIRSEQSLLRIRRYIRDNPARWKYDRDNPEGAPDDDEREFWDSLQPRAR